MSKGKVPRLTLGRKMRLAREDAHIGSQEMADLFGVVRHTITSYEADRHAPNRATIKEWARITGADPDWLMDDDAGIPAKNQLDLSGLPVSSDDLGRVIVDLLLRAREPGDKPPGYTPERVMSNFEIDLRSEEPEIVYHPPELADLKAG